jgi:hypothetical protein
MLTSASDKAYATTAVAAAGGGGTVTWSYYDWFSRQLDPSGLLGPIQVLTGLRPVAATSAGAQVLQSPFWNPITPGGLVVRPVGGDSDQAAPRSAGWMAVAAPVGRTVGLAWNTSPTGVGGRLAVSVWRP